MGALFFFMLNGMLATMMWGALRSRSERQKLTEEFRQKPLGVTLLLVELMGIMMFGWGVMTGGWLSFSFDTPWGRTETWWVGGLIALALAFPVLKLTR